MQECHFCLKKKQDYNQEIFFAKCCKNKCRKYYCLPCIKENFDQNFEVGFYRKDTWICYFCQNCCKCLICLEADEPILDRRDLRRKRNIDLSNFSKDESLSIALDEIKKKVKIDERLKEFSDSSFSESESNNSQPYPQSSLKLITERSTKYEKKLKTKDFETWMPQTINRVESKVSVQPLSEINMGAQIPIKSTIDTQTYLLESIQRKRSSKPSKKDKLLAAQNIAKKTPPYLKVILQTKQLFKTLYRQRIMSSAPSHKKPESVNFGMKDISQ